MQLGRSSVSLSDLVTAELLRPGQELTFHGRSPATATVTARGTITLDGSEYKSPSTAAKAVGGVSTNGWRAWYVNVAGEEISLAELRTRFLSR
jgi:RAMA domain-containing protein